MEKINEKSFYLIGLFSTFSALMVSIGGFETAITNIFILVVLMIQLKKGKIYFKSYKFIFLLFFLIMILSSTLSMYNLSSSWYFESIKTTIKMISFIMPFLLLFSDSELLRYRVFFFKGLLTSCIIQVLWEFIQIILWNFFNISFNEIVFSKILNIQTTHTWTFISDGRFRPTGIAWEPANLGLSLVIGFILCNNKYLKILFSMGILFSTSRTAIIIWAISIFIYLIKYKFKNIKRKKIRLKKIDLLVITTIIITLLIVLLFNEDKIVDKIEPILDGFKVTIEKLNFVGMKQDSSANMHANYYLVIREIFSKSTLIQILFGYGTATAGFPYSEYLGIYTYLSYWNPESDFITILIGNGIIGLIAYYWVLFRSLIYNKNNCNYYLMTVVIIIAGIFYLYFRSSWPLLILVMMFLKNDRS